MRPHDGRAIPTFLRQALQDKPLTVFGDGSQTRSFCYVDDLIRGFVALAESDVHQPVNIGNPDEMTLLELAEAVIEVDRARARRSSSRRCRSTIRRCASPTSHGRSSCSAGSRRSSSRDGLQQDDRAGRRRAARRRHGLSARPAEPWSATRAAADRPPDRDLPALPRRGAATPPSGSPRARPSAATTSRSSPRRPRASAPTPAERSCTGSSRSSRSATLP